MILAAAVGIPAGLLIGYSESFRAVFEPPLMALNSAAREALIPLYRHVEYGLEVVLWFLYNAPLVAFYPLLIIWFGLGARTVVAICFLLSVFPVMMNTVAGIRIADPVLIRCARSFCAPRVKLVTAVLLPGALPMVAAGMRIALGRALVGAVVGELFGGNKGLGFVISFASTQLQTGRVMAAIVVVVALGVTLTSVISAFEERLCRKYTLLRSSTLP